MGDVEVVYRGGNATYSIVGEVKVVDNQIFRVTQKGMCSLLRISDLVSVDEVAVMDYFAGKENWNGTIG